MNHLPDLALSLAPLLATTLAVVAALWLLHWLVLGRRSDIGKGRRLPRQLALLAATIAGLVLVVLALPVAESTRNQVITLIGVLLSGVIAFSSTTIVANVMAGLVLRMTQPFHTGDFIQAGEHFGRITERGLFDTEIQTEHRELVALSNSWLLANPVTVVLASGAIVSANVSLGYDVHHARVRSLLLAAAEKAGLKDPFVQVIELADHAVSYRINGLLSEVKSLLTARSELHIAVLDALHGDGVEIVSPAFMNQRQISPEQRFMPDGKDPQPVAVPDGSRAEDVVFDKAELAGQRAQARHALITELRRLEAEEKEAKGDDREALGRQIESVRMQLAELAALAVEEVDTEAVTIGGEEADEKSADPAEAKEADPSPTHTPRPSGKIPTSESGNTPNN